MTIANITTQYIIIKIILLVNKFAHEAQTITLDNMTSIAEAIIKQNKKSLELCLSVCFFITTLPIYPYHYITQKAPITSTHEITGAIT